MANLRFLTFLDLAKEIVPEGDPRPPLPALGETSSRAEGAPCRRKRRSRSERFETGLRSPPRSSRRPTTFARRGLHGRRDPPAPARRVGAGRSPPASSRAGSRRLFIRRIPAPVPRRDGSSRACRRRSAPLLGRAAPRLRPLRPRRPSRAAPLRRRRGPAGHRLRSRRRRDRSRKSLLSSRRRLFEKLLGVCRGAAPGRAGRPRSTLRHRADGRRRGARSRSARSSAPSTTGSRSTGSPSSSGIRSARSALLVDRARPPEDPLLPARRARLLALASRTRRTRSRRASPSEDFPREPSASCSTFSENLGLLPALGLADLSPAKAGALLTELGFTSGAREPRRLPRVGSRAARPPLPRRGRSRRPVRRSPRPRAGGARPSGEGRRGAPGAATPVAAPGDMGGMGGAPPPVVRRSSSGLFRREKDWSGASRPSRRWRTSSPAPPSRPRRSSRSSPTRSISPRSFTDGSSGTASRSSPPSPRADCSSTSFSSRGSSNSRSRARSAPTRFSSTPSERPSPALPGSPFRPGPTTGLFARSASSSGSRGSSATRASSFSPRRGTSRPIVPASSRLICSTCAGKTARRALRRRELGRFAPLPERISWLPAFGARSSKDLRSTPRKRSGAPSPGLPRSGSRSRSRPRRPPTLLHAPPRAVRRSSRRTKGRPTGPPRGSFFAAESSRPAVSNGSPAAPYRAFLERGLHLESFPKRTTNRRSASTRSPAGTRSTRRSAT